MGNEKVTKSEQEWREQLTQEQYIILREKGTERAFTGKYVNEKRPGVYQCAACGNPLFQSDTKFESGSGWPSFWDVVDEANVVMHEDTSYGMRRVEVTCARCGGHLGHVFPDGPRDKTGLRYCINSVSIQHEADAE
jgi:peptide-methionine (R)-S-oxide reductase